MSRTPDLLTFLVADGCDAAGRRFDDVLAFGDAELEAHHDFIQWLFPLDEPSRAVPNSPTLTRETIAALRASPVAQDRVAQAADRMLRFYRDTKAWRRPFDHNHLRITRIIKSLRLLAGDAAADGFRQSVSDLARDTPIDASARAFWARA